MISNDQRWPRGSCRAAQWLTCLSLHSSAPSGSLSSTTTTQLFVAALRKRDHKINDQARKRLNKRLTTASKETETPTRGRDSFMGWNSIALQTLPLRSEISTLFSQLKGGGNEQGRREEKISAGLAECYEAEGSSAWRRNRSSSEWTTEEEYLHVSEACLARRCQKSGC